MTRTRTTIISLGLTSVVTLAACSGSDSGSDADDPCAGTSNLASAYQAGEDAETPEEGLEAIRTLADALDEFARSAPDDIASDAEDLAAATRTLSEADPEGELTDEQTELLESDDLEAAGDRIEAYLEENCDIEF